MSRKCFSVTEATHTTLCALAYDLGVIPTLVQTGRDVWWASLPGWEWYDNSVWGNGWTDCLVSGARAETALHNLASEVSGRWLRGPWRGLFRRRRRMDLTHTIVDVGDL